MKKDNPYRNLALLSQIAISMLVPIIGCFLLGNYIDTKLNTNHTFLVILTILGVLAAFRNLYIIGMKFGTDRKDDED